MLNDGTWTYYTYLAVYVGHPFVSYDDNIIHQCEFACEQNTGPPFFFSASDLQVTKSGTCTHMSLKFLFPHDAYSPWHPPSHLASWGPIYGTAGDRPQTSGYHATGSYSFKITVTFVAMGSRRVYIRALCLLTDN